MSNDTACYTVVANHNIPKARFLCSLIKEIYPAWSVYLVLTEPLDNHYNKNDQGFTIIRYDELGVNPLESWLFMHNEEETKRAFKVFSLIYIMKKIKPKKIIYFDLFPKSALLEKITTSLNEYSLCFIPKMMKPDKEKTSVVEHEIKLLREGSFDCRIFGIRNDDQGKRFADWWKQRINTHCYQNDERGIYFEEKWCNLVPAIFDNVCIIGDNLDLIEQGEIEFPEDNLLNDWVYGFFSNGKIITDEMRWIYRRRKDLQKKYPFPFTINHGEKNLFTFFTWFERHKKSSRQE